MNAYVDLDFELALSSTQQALENGNHGGIQRAYVPPRSRAGKRNVPSSPIKSSKDPRRSTQAFTFDDVISEELPTATQPIKMVNQIAPPPQSQSSSNNNKHTHSNTSKKSSTNGEVAGYERFTMNNCYEEAQEIVLDSSKWISFASNPQVISIIKKQAGRKKSHTVFGDLRFIKDLAYNKYIDFSSDLVIEAIAMILKEIHFQTICDNDVSAVGGETENAIHEIINKSLGDEEYRRTRAVEQASRTADIRQRILAIKQEKEGKIERKRVEMIEKDIRKKEEEKRLLLETGISKYELRDQDILMHQTKQNERLKARMDKIHNEQDIKSKRRNELDEINRQRMLEDAIELENRKAAARGISGRAEEIDLDFRAQTAEGIKRKEDKSLEYMTQHTNNKSQHLSSLRDRHELLDFRAAQRRRLMADERKNKLDLVAIRHKKLDASIRVKSALVGQRRQMLHKVFEEFLPSPSRGGGALQVTPGPGDYDLDRPRPIKGGRISSSGAKPSGIAKAAPPPGPGDYSPKMPPLATGAVPFNGRGKTYVDDLVLREKKTPGPGYYNFGNKRIPGGKISQAKVPSQVEILMNRKVKEPGPGDYNLSTDPPPPLKTLMREFNELTLLEQFPEL